MSFLPTKSSYLMLKSCAITKNVVPLQRGKKGHGYR